DRFVPPPCLLLDVDAGGMPKIDFRNMRTGPVATRDKGRTLGFDSLQRKYCVPGALDAGRIVLWPDQDKVIVHHGIALHAKTFRNKFLLRLLCMHEYYVGIAATRYVEGLAGALGDHSNVDAGLLLEQGKDKTEQPGILRRSRRGNQDRFPLRRSERDLRKGKRNRKRDRPEALEHGISP